MNGKAGENQMIIGFPHKPGFGGPGSFQSRMEKELAELGIGIVYPDSGPDPDVVLIVGGTRRLGWLRSCRRKGIPIVYRLDGINWLHRQKGTKQRNLRDWLESESINLLYKYVHAFLSDYIVYQSDFVYEWWVKVGWKKDKPYSIIGNGVDINTFCPSNNGKEVTIICLEGTLDYTPYAVRLINELGNALSHYPFKVYGSFSSEDVKYELDSSIQYCGKVKREELPMVYQNSIYISLDINAACPNTVIEALASGAPVVGYDTGSLKELVSEGAGEIIPYGDDIWKIIQPDVIPFVKAIDKIYQCYQDYSLRARNLALSRYQMKEVVAKYLYVFEQLVERPE